MWTGVMGAMGGRYLGYNPDRQGEKMHMELARNLTRETGFEAMMRVRTSKGVQVGDATAATHSPRWARPILSQCGLSGRG